MTKTKKPIRMRKSIITGYLEKISAKVFTDYSRVITDMVEGHQGIYALYKNDRLYYVGLASNLKNRIKHHLKDRHKGQWTHFSLYIVRVEEHIKEIESMILRISYPKGNTMKGKLKSKDLRPLLKNMLRAEWEKQFGDILGRSAHRISSTAKKTSIKLSKKVVDRPLKNMFRAGKCLYANYKGQDFKAWVYASGTIKYDGKLFDSPSAAGRYIRGGKATNGWSFWKIKDKNGNFVKLDTLRK